ncbi:hypothetical protein AcW2_006142 [Taiwanofungus camphoratus]|nr:hypothetical protein AcW2_006142 [Antrodia cinnamomea]
MICINISASQVENMLYKLHHSMLNRHFAVFHEIWSLLQGGNGANIHFHFSSLYQTSGSCTLTIITIIPDGLTVTCLVMDCSSEGATQASDLWTLRCWYPWE